MWAESGFCRARQRSLYYLMCLFCRAAVLAADRAVPRAGTGRGFEPVGAAKHGADDSASGRAGAAQPRAKGNAEAERALTRHGDRILRLAYSYLHNMQDAEDILQETLIRYMERAPVFASDEHEKAWLLRVGANLAKNRIDYNALRRTDELCEALVAEREEDLSCVWEAVKKLSPAQREAVHLFYHEGYSSAETAALLGEKESTVRSHLRRGREKLRSILKEEYDFD